MKKKKALIARLPSPKYSLKNKLRNHACPCLPYGYFKSLAYKYGILNHIDMKLALSGGLDLGGDAFIINYLQEYNPDFLVFPALSECNYQRSAYIAEKLKRINPCLKIIASGPEVSNNTSDLLENSAVDFGAPLIFGEKNFQLLFKNILTGSPVINHIDGVFYRKNDNKICFTSPDAGINGVKNIPSPYLLGFLKPGASAAIETTRRALKGNIYAHFEDKKLSFRKIGDIEEELILLKKMNVRFITLTDPAFNYSDEWFKKICGLILRVNSDKKLCFEGSVMADSIAREHAKILKDCNFCNLRIELKTINESVLRKNNEFIDIKKWKEGIMRLRDYGLAFTIGIIAGMPHDNLKSFKNTVNFLVENALAAQCECFPLYIDPCSYMWKKAASLGIKFQKNPPHLFLGSDTFVFEEMREAFEYARQMGCKIPSEVFSEDNYPQLITRAGAAMTEKRKKKKGEDNLPETRLIIDLDAPAHYKKLYSWAEKRSAHLANAVVVWFKGDKLFRKIEIMKKILKILSSPNPYTVWNIVLESDCPVNKKFVDEIESSIVYLPHNLDYQAIYLADSPYKEHYRAAARFYVVYKYCRGVLQYAPTIKYHFYYSLNLKAGYNMENRIKHALSQDCEGILIDFEKDFDLSAIKKIMKFVKENNWKKKIVQFRALDLQCVWDLEFDGKNAVEGEEENIVYLGHSKSQL